MSGPSLRTYCSLWQSSCRSWGLTTCRVSHRHQHRAQCRWRRTVFSSHITCLAAALFGPLLVLDCCLPFHVCGCMAVLLADVAVAACPAQLLWANSTRG
jgi:hypothetical protein